MNRRSFLQVFAASTTSYFLAPKCGWKTSESGLSVPVQPAVVHAKLEHADSAFGMVDVLMCGIFVLENGDLWTIRPGDRPVIIDPNRHVVDMRFPALTQTYFKKDVDERLTWGWNAERNRG